MGDSAGFRETLEVFPNPNPRRNFIIEHRCPEFTSVCPKTGQPDFGEIVFRYVPDEVCVELKSLKLYLQRFRNEGIFYEAVTNRIMDDFLAVVKPRSATVESRWTPRGGLHSNLLVRFPDGPPTLGPPTLGPPSGNPATGNPTPGPVHESPQPSPDPSHHV